MFSAESLPQEGELTPGRIQVYMSSYISSIKLLGAGLSDGESTYETCPACGKKGKLALTKQEDGSGLLFHCFRPSCTLHKGGNAGGSSGVRNPLQPKVVRTTLRPYTGTLVPLPSEEESTLHQQIGFSSEHLEIARPLWSPDFDRVAFPMFGPYGERKGWVLRSYRGAEPKALTFQESGDSKLCYYGNHKHRPTVVVEDIPSAVRASLYVNAVALLGTGLNKDVALELAAHTDSVIWALDNDAFDQGMRLHLRHRMLFSNSHVMYLGVDFKNMDEDDLSTMLGGLDDRT